MSKKALRTRFKNRTYKIDTRFSQDERELIQKAADQISTTPAEIMRQGALAYASVLTSKPEEMELIT